MAAPWTMQEVHARGPSTDGSMAISLLGIVYDVSGGRSFFGPSGPYRIYTGHDATFALATMSLRSIDLDVFDYVLDDVERESLADWLRYFDVKLQDLHLSAFVEKIVEPVRTGRPVR